MFDKAGEITNADLARGIESVVQSVEKLAVMTADKFEKIDERFEKIDERFEKIDRKFEQVDKRIELLAENLNLVKADIHDIKLNLGPTNIVQEREIDELKDRVSILEGKTA